MRAPSAALLLAAVLSAQAPKPDPQAALATAMAAAKSGKTSVAARQFEDLVRTNPPPAVAGQARLELVRIYQVRGEWWDAIRHLRELRKLAPGEAEYAYQLGLAYRNLAKWAFEQMKAAGPESARFQQILGEQHAIGGEPEKAAAAYAKAIAADPKLPGSHLALAALYAQAGKREEALAEVDRELEVSPESAAAKQFRQALGGGAR